MLIGSDAIGEVVSVHFEWMLDTRYDADDGLLLEDGVNSIMAVIAANRSFATGKPVHIRVLLRA